MTDWDIWLLFTGMYIAILFFMLAGCLYVLGHRAGRRQKRKRHDDEYDLRDNDGH